MGRGVGGLTVTDVVGCKGGGGRKAVGGGRQYAGTNSVSL